MWDNYFTTPGAYPRTLGDEIEADGQRPIVVEARRNNIGGKEGLLVWGYNLEQAGLELAFTDRTGAPHTTALALRPCTASQAGISPADLPARLQASWSPFDGNAPSSGTRMSLTATNNYGRAHHAFILRSP